MSTPLLEVQNLSVIFQVDQHQVTAVNDISFQIQPQTMVGLVGESGSGKSVTALAILDLLAKNGRIKSGAVYWKGKNLRQISAKGMSQVRGKEIGLILQNPQAALNPVYTIGNQMIETIRLHQKVSTAEAKQIAIDLLQKVRIPDAETRLNDYPHHFSMGMCQRIMIALTLAMKPQLIIADEPTASLDVTIQTQVMALLNELKQELGISILLISHDLGVIAQHCDQVMIMYLGNVVEIGSPHSIFKAPLHPYTQALISSIPIPDPDQKQSVTLLKGEIPSPMNAPMGCPFHPRCPKAFEPCSKVAPQLQKESDSQVACLLYQPS